MPLATEINGRLYAVHTDQLNTPRQLTDENGQKVWQWAISGFGELEPTTAQTGWVRARNGSAGQISNTLPVTFNLRFPGQQFDEETGLHYNHHRYYDPYLTVGYTEADPLGLEAGWNRFAYVDGDPLGYSDAEGLFKFHGNWCGPDWTGGYRKPWDQLTEEEKENVKRPIDVLDSCCKTHDMDYAQCREKYPCDEYMQRRCKEGADRKLYQCSRKSGNGSFILEDYMRRSSPGAELSCKSTCNAS